MSVPHMRFRFLDHCGRCGGVMVFFQTKGGKTVAGCDCSPTCDHPHRPTVYDMAYAVMGEPVRSRVQFSKLSGSDVKE